MLQRIGYSQLAAIMAFQKCHALHNLAVLSDLQRWSPRYAHITLNLVGYVDAGQIIAVSALYRDGRWLPFFTHPAAIQPLIADHGDKPMRWVIGAGHVLCPLLASLQNRGLSWDYDEQGLRCSVDQDSWHPYNSSKVSRATEDDLEDVTRLRIAFSKEYFGSPTEHINHSTFRDFVRPYIKQGIYIAKVGTQTVSMVTIEAAVKQGIKLGAVYTQPEYRNQGWAKAVVSAACREHIQKTERIVLDVRHDNGPARHAYQALGFRSQSEYRMVRLRR